MSVNIFVYNIPRDMLLLRIETLKQCKYRAVPLFFYLLCGILQGKTTEMLRKVLSYIAVLEYGVVNIT